MVVGPTPPTRGVIAARDLLARTRRRRAAACGPRSGRRRRSRPSPGCTCSGCTMPGTPAAAMRMSARRVYSGQSGTPVCTTVTAALAVGPLLAEQQRQRPAEGEAPAEDDDVAARDRDLVVREQRLDARRRAGTGPGTDSASRPRFIGWSPSTSLSGSISVEGGLVVEVARDRVLDEHAVDGRVVVEPAHGGEQRRPGSRRPAAPRGTTRARARRTWRASCGRSRRWPRRRRRGSCRDPAGARRRPARRCAA